MPEQDPGPPRTVGALLAHLRRERGMTGTELGRRIGVSQAKISKIEGGTAAAKLEDVLKIAAVLDAPPDFVRSLVEMLENEPNRLGRWHTVGPAPNWAQPDISALEAAAKEIRSFQVSVPSGLLHTTGYARAVLADYTRPLDEVTEAGAVPAAVTARMRRQEILADSEKTFLFMMTETTLLNRVAKPAAMLEQVERIREAAAQPNVFIRILRSDAEMVYPPLHDFHLVDGRVVIIDTMTTTVVTRDASDLKVYRRVFEYFWAQATPEIEPILDSYARLYADLARPAAGPGGAQPTAADLVAPPQEGDGD